MKPDAIVCSFQPNPAFVYFCRYSDSSSPAIVWLNLYSCYIEICHGLSPMLSQENAVIRCGVMVDVFIIFYPGSCSARHIFYKWFLICPDIIYIRFYYRCHCLCMKQ